MITRKEMRTIAWNNYFKAKALGRVNIRKPFRLRDWIDN